MGKLRVMYILKHYPQISESYIKTEIESIWDECEVQVVSMKPAPLAYTNHKPFRLMPDLAEIREAIEEFRPNVLHSHWLHTARDLARLARRTHVPFTIRAHSFDTLWREDKGPSFNFFGLLNGSNTPKHLRRGAPVINDDYCLGILAFPYARPRLEKVGIRSDKITDCFPVVNVRRFHDASANGDAVMNIGACIGKKKMEDFLKLATQRRNTEFNLYALGYNVEQMKAKNQALGNPVNIIPPIEHEDMAPEYKKHRWLVYTASKGGNVGWPMAIAEAQASGVGVCMANIRPDLRDYVGAAGFLFNSVGEALEIISKPFPEEKRQLGFELAQRSDISQHKVLLKDLWRKASHAEAA